MRPKYIVPMTITLTACCLLFSGEAEPSPAPRQPEAPKGAMPAVRTPELPKQIPALKMTTSERRIEPPGRLPAFLEVLERIKTHPEAGTLNLGYLKGDLVKVFATEDAERTKMETLQKSFETELSVLALEWESRVQKFREETEQAMIGELPQDKQERAKKLMQAGGTYWKTVYDREQTFRKKLSFHRNRNLRPGDTVSQTPEREEFNPSEFRLNALREDSTKIKALREVLTEEEANRLTGGTNWDLSSLQQTRVPPTESIKAGSSR